MRKKTKIAAIIIVILMIVAFGSLHLRERPDSFTLTRGEFVVYQMPDNEVKGEMWPTKSLMPGKRAVSIGQYGVRILEPIPWDQVGP